MKLISLCLIFSLVLHGYAQQGDIFKPDSIRRGINAVKIQSSLRIDGFLNEPEWQLTPTSSGFIQIEPQQGAVPNFQTVVKVLYNSQSLYLGFFAKDSMGKKAIRGDRF